MFQNSPNGSGSSKRLALPLGISARHQLLSNSRMTADVEKLESAIRQFKADPDAANNCEVVFFETVGDTHLHCNVTHRHATKSITGWAGPGRVADGFVHNRTFGETGHHDMVRQIRAMVFAARV